MARKNKTDQPPTNPSRVHLTLPGFITLCISLLAVSSLMTYFLTVTWLRPHLATKAGGGKKASATAALEASPPWGNLVTYDIQLERPEEYVAQEITSNHPPAWIFVGMNAEQTRATLQNCGFTTEQVQAALSPERVVTTGGRTVISPPDELLTSLPATNRAQLYRILAQWPENHYMQYPFVFSGNSFAALTVRTNISQPILGLLDKLVYPRADDLCFSDFELVLSKIPEEGKRLQIVRALSQQSAVLARLKISPNSDIDKIASYWTAAPGVRIKDVRPLLESLKNTPEGGNISLLYFLPPFARMRLYTFPLPPKPGDPRADCHWSTMNFFNEVPDNRFNDSAYTAKYLDQNYYAVAKPNAYGDLIFLLDGQNQALHSAVHIADDIVFTKNGDNYLQPWVFMHLKDLVNLYTAEPPLRMMVYRNRGS